MGKKTLTQKHTHTIQTRSRVKMIRIKSTTFKRVKIFFFYFVKINFVQFKLFQKRKKILLL